MIDNWKELTIGKYLEICRIDEREEVTSMDGANKTSEILAILSGKTADEVERMPFMDYLAMREKSEFLYTKIPEDAVDFSKDDTIILDGGRYRATTSVEGMTARQFIDFEAVSKMTPLDVALCLATMIVPEGKEYGVGYDTQKVAETIRDNMSMVTAVSYQAFFLKFWRAFMDYFRTYSGKLPKEVDTPEVRELMEKMKEVSSELSTQSGDGFIR